MRAALLILLLLLGAPATAQTISGRVVAVHDGDTISVRTARSTVRVRLVDIDCPEAGQPYSARARRFTTEQVLGRDVTVRGEGRDQYDRLLGRVLLDGRDINEALVRAGLAWRYTFDGPPDGPLADAERQARLERRGLWSAANPIPPWQWRRAHPREERTDSRRRSSRRGRDGVEPDNPAGPLRGNTRSRVFHRPGCPNYRCRNCTELFLTAASALDAGFRPAGDCHDR